MVMYTYMMNHECASKNSYNIWRIRQQCIFSFSEIVLVQNSFSRKLKQCGKRIAHIWCCTRWHYFHQNCLWRCKIFNFGVILLNYILSVLYMWETCQNFHFACTRTTIFSKVWNRPLQFNGSHSTYQIYYKVDFEEAG